VASRIWVAALGVVALAAPCICGCSGGSATGSPAATRPPTPAGSADRVCTASACVSLGQLAHSIDTQLRGTAVGYVALVGRSHAVASGLARTAGDLPKLAMGPDVMVNVASVGKMFTTIAVLQSLARHHLSIDSRISPFLPPDWVRGPGVDTITFRELLTHRAGFRLDSGLVFTTDNAAKEQIKQGINRVDKQVPSYVQRQVFDPMGVTDARCAPVRDAMLMYLPPFSGTAPGIPVPVGPSGCAGGGWFMTPAGMLQVLDGLISDRLLPGSQRQLMDDNCLGWDCSIAGQAGYRGKYGGCCGPGPAGLQVFFGILAATIPVVIATNSNGPPPLQAVVQTALHTATSPR
jgi:CubicO group peptidase (beta-lactamase class C family)